MITLQPMIGDGDPYQPPGHAEVNCPSRYRPCCQTGVIHGRRAGGQTGLLSPSRSAPSRHPTHKARPSDSMSSTNRKGGRWMCASEAVTVGCKTRTLASQSFHYAPRRRKTRSGDRRTLCSGPSHRPAVTMSRSHPGTIAGPAGATSQSFQNDPSDRWRLMSCWRPTSNRDSQIDAGSGPECQAHLQSEGSER